MSDNKPRVDWSQTQHLMVLSQQGSLLAVQHLHPDIAEVPYGTCAMMMALGKAPATVYHCRMGEEKPLKPGSIIRANFRQGLSESLKAKTLPVIDLVG